VARLSRKRVSRKARISEGPLKHSGTLDLPLSRKPTKRFANNLPRRVTSFIGRQREIGEVKQLLATTRLVTLTGAGGVGKTRLALQIASEVLERFSGGVWMVEFAALSKPTLVVKTVASALSVSEQPDRSLMETLIDHLSSESLLLLFDNCEHLLSTCAHLANVLMRACPRLRILATSRGQLGIAGESAYRVPSLSFPDPHDLPHLENLMQYEAIRLFMERAGSCDPEFTVTESNASAVVQVCHRLDGIPLAIELAAARIKVLTPQEIAQRLGDWFRLLRGGPRDAPERHQSLQATISWSYELLTPEEQRLFRRLAIFCGGFAVESAEAVCGNGDVDILDGLSSLIDKSLLTRITSPVRTARFRMLETIREYGIERLAAEVELDGTRSRHAEYFAALSEQTESDMGSTDEERWLHRLWQDIENVRTAVDWSLRSSPQTSARLGGGLGWLFYNHGHLTEGYARMEQILRATGDVDDHLRSRVLFQAGVLAWGLGEWYQARVWLEQSLVLFRRHGDARRQAMATAFYGHVSRSRGEFEEASKHYQTALGIYRHLGSEWGIAWALFDLGLAARDGGHDDEAVALHEQSLALFRNQGHRWGIAWQLWSLGVLAHRRGDDAHAREHFAESLSLYRALDDRRGIAQSLEGLATIVFVAGRMRETARVLSAANAVRAGLSARLAFSDRQEYDRTLEGVKASMAAGEFEQEWNSGRSLELDDAIQLALDAAQLAITPIRPPKKSRESLTSREREVSALIARGLSNRGIATKLSIAERTAISHVEHIMNKLGLHSRAQIAAWAVRHGLDVPAES